MMYQFVKLLRAMRIVTKLTYYHVVSTVIFWLLRLLPICSSLFDSCGHETDRKTQFLPSVSSYSLAGLGAK